MKKIVNGNLGAAVSVCPPRTRFPGGHGDLLRVRFHAGMMLVGVLSLASWAAGQQTRPAEVIKVTIHAAPATRPAAHYRLMPDLIDQRPGNGAPLYLAGARVGPDPKASEELTGKLGDRLREMPLEKLAGEDVTSALQPFTERLAMIDLAARREDAVWESTLRDQGAYAPLPYLNDVRIDARLLNVKARWQIARRDWAGAERTLQTAMSMAYQMNNRAVLIQALVEAGIVELTLDRVLDWAGQAEAPNLYWALTDLPRPFVDQRSVRRTEESMVYFTFPQLAGPVEEVSTEQWRKIWAAMEGLVSPQDRPAGGMRSLVAATLSRAKGALVESGVPKEAVEAMSAEQAVGIYLFRQYRAAAEEAWRDWQLPYWQSRAVPGGNVRESEHRRVMENPFMTLVPVVSRAKLVFARVDRKVCVLRVVEALRDYAAGHGGQMPASLDELQQLPAPLNPVTGKPFGYRGGKGEATLEVESDSPGRGRVEYRLTVGG